MKLLRLAAAILAMVAFPCFALAQQAILQGGPWTPGHAPMYVGAGSSQPIVQDSGPAGGGPAGVGLSELGLAARGTGTPPFSGTGTGPFGTNLCDYDAPTTNATGYHFLCFSPNAQGGGGLIAYGAAGSAAVQPLNMNINGTLYTFPFVIGGIVGPNTSTVNDLACWNNTAGTLLKDCGAPIFPSSSITFSQTGPSAVPRTVNAELLEEFKVTQFGADPTGVADSAPAFRAAMASNRLIIVPQGTYRFASTVTAPCCAFNAPAVLVQNLSNFKMTGPGATIVIDPAIALSTAFHFDQDRNFEVSGLTIQGTRSALNPGDENVAIGFSSDVNFHVHDLHFTGNFGGQGAGFAGDWLVNGKIDHVVMDAVGQCSDFAYLRNFTLSDWTANGADTNGVSGSGQVGNKCVSFVTDTPNIANNHTGITYNASDNISVHNMSVSNFGTGALIATGTHYTFSQNNWSNNPGLSPSIPGIGVFIDYVVGGNFPSVGFPPSEISINGDKFVGNGGAQAGSAVFISQNAIANSDVIANINIQNSLFDNNAATAIDADGSTHLSNLILTGNSFSGAAQVNTIGTSARAAATAYNDRGLNFSSNGFILPNNTTLQWADGSGSFHPTIGVSPANILFARPASSAAFGQLQDFAGNPLLQWGDTGVSLGATGAPIQYKGVEADTTYSFQSPTNGFSISVGVGIGSLILSPSGTLAGGTVTLPAGQTDGQIFRLACTQTVTALTIAVTGGDTITGPTSSTCSNSQGRSWIFSAAHGLAWIELY
ncbi:hypothetical protein FHT86_002145 [Rhizobium sp. BK313]|uniref:glycosyl hydrolase family 28-related protein n=1 Tax=Rhizobium sp. BK313 TaxID=2587081 RepID=UPI0016218144|nr:glycosyl hydrolase family 28-related protein [Rhizobium sp. BK313]MBB3453889.1 hypothetical protein [Rhizobium sp. BK313]